MTPENWAGLIVSVITIITSFVVMIKWLVKHYLVELKPNGGGSLNDKVKLELIPMATKNNENITTLLQEQAVIKQRVADHIASHESGHFKQ